MKTVLRNFVVLVIIPTVQKKSTKVVLINICKQNPIRSTCPKEHEGQPILFLNAAVPAGGLLVLA